MSRKRDEPVRLTKIYTRGGDRGETSLGDGSRVSKLDPRVGAYGVVDELNAHSALRSRATCQTSSASRCNASRTSSSTSEPTYRCRTPTPATGSGSSRAQIDGLEALCDRFNADLPELKSFVLPGGTEAAARLHVARTVCRRAERDVLAAAAEMSIDPLAPAYLNRLSDLLFILARAANAGGDEPLWAPGASRPTRPA